MWEEQRSWNTLCYTWKIQQISCHRATNKAWRTPGKDDPEHHIKNISISQLEAIHFGHHCCCLFVAQFIYISRLKDNASQVKKKSFQGAEVDEHCSQTRVYLTWEPNGFQLHRPIRIITIWHTSTSSMQNQIHHCSLLARNTECWF